MGITNHRVYQCSIWRAKPSVVLQIVYLICLCISIISNRNKILMNHAERKIQLSFYLFSIRYYKILFYGKVIKDCIEQKSWQKLTKVSWEVE